MKREDLTYYNRDEIATRVIRLAADAFGRDETAAASRVLFALATAMVAGWDQELEHVTNAVVRQMNVAQEATVQKIRAESAKN